MDRSALNPRAAAAATNTNLGGLQSSTMSSFNLERLPYTSRQHRRTLPTHPTTSSTLWGLPTAHPGCWIVQSLQLWSKWPLLQTQEQPCSWETHLRTHTLQNSALVFQNGNHCQVSLGHQLHSIGLHRHWSWWLGDSGMVLWQLEWHLSQSRHSRWLHRCWRNSCPKLAWGCRRTRQTWSHSHKVVEPLATHLSFMMLKRPMREYTRGISNRCIAMLQLWFTHWNRLLWVLRGADRNHLSNLTLRTEKNSLDFHEIALLLGLKEQAVHLIALPHQSLGLDMLAQSDQTLAEGIAALLMRLMCELLHRHIFLANEDRLAEEIALFLFLFLLRIHLCLRRYCRLGFGLGLDGCPRPTGCSWLLSAVLLSSWLQPCSPISCRSSSCM